MNKRKIENNRVRNLQKHSGSYSVTLPPEIIREFKWKEGQKVVVEKYGKNKILIRDWTKK